MTTTPPSPTKDEKFGDDHVERVDETTTRSKGAQITVDTVLDPEQRIRAERSLVRKLDCRVLPMIFLIFVMNYIGKSLKLKKELP